MMCSACVLNIECMHTGLTSTQNTCTVQNLVNLILRPTSSLRQVKSFSNNNHAGGDGSMCLSVQFSAVHSVPTYDTLSKETVATIVRALTIHWIKEIETVSDILHSREVKNCSTGEHS